MNRAGTARSRASGRRQKTGWREHTSRVYEEIRQRILEGVYGPSESLPELTLAGELSVSRHTVRKALLKLERENLVVIEENKRARVRAFSIDEIEHYLEVRELLEGLIVRQSLAHLERARVDRLRAILADMRKCLDDHRLLQYSALNTAFHETIYDACPNRPAVDLTRTIKNQLKRYNLKTILIEGRGTRSIAEHGRILAAIEQGNGRAAERAMRAHIANVRKILHAHHAMLI